MSRSCAARSRTPGSPGSTSARPAQVPGVVAAFSGADFAAEQGSLPCAWPVTPDIVIPAHPPMATEEVRYVGEAVACVVARDRYTAADAVSAMDVDYEPLPPVLDIRTALDAASPRVHEAGNKSFEFLLPNGDLDAAFRDAPVVIERTYRQQRLIPSAMEPRAVVGWNEGDEYTLWSSTQIPHVLRVMLALTTGIPEQNIRVIAPDVGGGFGSKLQVTAEEVLALLISRKVGRPVKWTESRSEGNLTVHHGRDQWQRIKLAADSDGRIRGPGRRPAGRHGRLPDAGHPGHPAARRVHVQRHLQDGRLLVQVHRHLQHQDADRRLPGCRAPGGHVRPRADHGRARGRAGHGSAAGPRAELDQARGVPLRHDLRAHLRQRQLRGGHGPGQGTVRLRRTARRAAAPPGQQ